MYPRPRCRTRRNPTSKKVQIMSPTNDRSQGRDDARRPARDEKGYARRIDCADRPRMEAAPRPSRGPGSPADARWSRSRGGAR